MIDNIFLLSEYTRSDCSIYLERAQERWSVCVCLCIQEICGKFCSQFDSTSHVIRYTLFALNIIIELYQFTNYLVRPPCEPPHKRTANTAHVHAMQHLHCTCTARIQRYKYTIGHVVCVHAMYNMCVVQIDHYCAVRSVECIFVQKFSSYLSMCIQTNIPTK